MTLIQLDFFEQTETSILKAEIAELKEKLDKQRKSQFGKIGACTKDIQALKEDMDLLKRHICKGL